MQRVVLESPYAGNVSANVAYAQECMRDCIMRGEAPIASHLLYTQPGILRDDIPEERARGIEAELIWGACAEKTAAYIDRGISDEMKQAIARAEKDGRPVEYRTLRPVKITTLTGPSGAGKTSIAKELLALPAELGLVVSLTSRAPRREDLPGEYRCGVLPVAFKGNPDFLWIASAHGNAYGTLRSSVDDALLGDAPSLMMLVPEVLATLRSYAEARFGGGVLSFYILPPPEAELRKRLKRRGDGAAEIEARIADCRQWTEAARNSSTPYIFISNDEEGAGVKNAAREILKYIC